MRGKWKWRGDLERKHLPDCREGDIREEVREQGSEEVRLL